MPLRGGNWRWLGEASSLLVTAHNIQIYLYVHSKAYVPYIQSKVNFCDEQSISELLSHRYCDKYSFGDTSFQLLNSGYPKNYSGAT